MEERREEDERGEKRSRGKGVAGGGCGARTGGGVARVGGDGGGAAASWLRHSPRLQVSVAAASHAVLPAQEYWNKVLPTTPMPAAIQHFLYHSDALVEEKTGGTSVGVGKGGVNVNTGRGKPGGTTVNVGPHSGVGVNVRHGPGGTHVGVGPGGVHVNTGKGKPGGGTHVGVGHGGVSVNTGHKGKPVVVNVRPGYNPFYYHYAATETQIHEDPHVAFFFLEKDLHPGSKLTLRFAGQPSAAAGFIPRREADSIPFASDKFSEILQRVSVSPGSESGMRKTVAECEEPAADGEKKKCATSLESMVDFATSSLGTRDVSAVSTTAVKGDAARERVYAVSSVRRLKGEETVACHSEPYAYAVFYCHTAQRARGYLVDLVAEDGSAEVAAVAVCHEDTSGWNPGHVAFKALKVRPGTVPVCHFMPEDHVLWARRG